MKKDNIFFGEEGLTSTSANHIANMAKEMYEGLEESLANTRLYNEWVTIVGSDKKTPVAIGMDYEGLATIPDKIATISKLKSLISWLREAIKARKHMVDEVRNMTKDKYCELMNIELPKEPGQNHLLTEDEYWASLSVKERNRYYTLETECANLGKYIHKNGHLSKARDKYYNVLNNPTEITGTGRDTIIISYECSVSKDNLENMFFKLQARHRELQAELNAMKHKCDIAIEQSANEAISKYTADYEKYKEVLDDIIIKMIDYKNTECTRIQKLKIIIPNDLKDIYNVVNNVGKDKTNISEA